MKTLPKMEISDGLDAQFVEGTKASKLCIADVIEHTAQDLPSRLASIVSNPSHPT